MLTLKVPFERFAEEVEKHLQTKEIYLSQESDHVCLTAIKTNQNFIVFSTTSESIHFIQEDLEHKGFQVREGCWTLNESYQKNASIERFISAISYISEEQKPGLWVDVSLTEPTPAEVLKKIYNEFKESGELKEVGFEEFVRFAHPNVVILSQEQLLSLQK